ncbi:zinc finger Ran-binding domain-containing protein [Leptospira yasudae]|nr:Ran-binding zinc finger domain-containing protein [Leptospira yasudae]
MQIEPERQNEFHFMKWICHHCRYANPITLGRCIQCGNTKGENAETTGSTSFLQKILKLGTFGWALIILVGLACVILLPILFIVALSNVEGLASAILLIAGFYGARSALRSAFPDPAKAIFLVFFSIMGVAIDQPGNYLYNYPMNFLCPEKTTVTRNLVVTHPLPERTDMTQAFLCKDENENEFYRIPMLHVLGIRFLEYSILGIFFLLVQGFFLRTKTTSS